MISQLLNAAWSLGSVVFAFALLLYWIAVVVLLIQEDREPTVTLAWILVLILTPVWGLVMYFFLGRDWPAITQKNPRTKALVKIVVPFMSARVYSRYSRRAQALERSIDSTVEERIIRAIELQNGAQPLPARSLDIYTTGAEYFPVLIDDLRSAERFIHMQYFIWESDELTAQVCDALMERLRAGVEVRILNDFIGNIQYKKDQLKALEQAGARVGYDVAQIGRANYRNHRKITVVDGEIAHTGGFNIAQEYIDGGKRFPAWRDTGLRLTGPAVADLERLFGKRWYEVYEESLFSDEYYPLWPEDEGPVMVQTVAQGVDDAWRSVARTYELAISGARSRVLVQSPYFVPDSTSLDVLINAALGGVEVHFMMTGWPDKKIAYFAAESFYKPFIRAGGRMWRYEEGFFHAKSLTIDDRACAIGTMNMDMRSLKLHKELMVWCYDDDVAGRCNEIFEDDLTRCREVTLEEVESWGELRRFRNSAARLASNLL
ncbi:MAG: cardiolipin synthase [Coriobacteriales bacterium]|nr:cardiolipin synthase [Coriobacteriales bacterium]